MAKKTDRQTHKQTYRRTNLKAKVKKNKNGLRLEMFNFVLVIGEFSEV